MKERQKKNEIREIETKHERIVHRSGRENLKIFLEKRLGERDGFHLVTVYNVHCTYSLPDYIGTNVCGPVRTLTLSLLTGL